MNLPAPIRLPGIEVSWAGPGLIDGGFCFGTEDGKLIFTTLDGVQVTELDPVFQHSEAVNGVAYLRNAIAVSTRAEVAICEIEATGGGKPKRALFPLGAHGVLATPSGCFVAPLGHSGLMIAKPDGGDHLAVRKNQAQGEGFNFYKAVVLERPSLPVVVACAARTGGITAAILSQEQEEGGIHSVTFPGQDIVDLCSLRSGLYPNAICAVAKNGTLAFFRDLLENQDPITLQFEEVRGSAYRLLSSRGHLFLLTRSGLYVLADLSRRFLEGEPIALGPTRVRGFPAEAVDMNLVGDRWLLLVMPDGVMRIDLELFLAQTPLAGSNSGEQDYQPLSAHLSSHSANRIFHSQTLLGV